MRFAIIDLANLFGRAQHVVRGDAFTKAGMTLHIIFRSLRKLYREMNVDHMVFCVEGRSWRYDYYPAYKAKRRLDRLNKSEREREEDEVFYEVQRQFVEYLAEKTRCTVLQCDGVEGDDFVARWIQLHPNDEHFILSGDSDFVQLLAPNVTIIDGVSERIITIAGVKTFKGEECVFSICQTSGKIKVAGTVEEVARQHKRSEQNAKKKDPSYKPKEFKWEPPSPDEEWWKKALFVKCIRGDVGDGIQSAYPGVRYYGSSKKTGIHEAWEDRKSGGYHWNNFMLQRWEKLVETDGSSPVTKEVRVIDEYERNRLLIDLTAQPDEVKERMDAVIIAAIQKEPVDNVGVNFLRFCAANNLPALSKEAHDHAAYLNAGYVK